MLEKIGQGHTSIVYKWQSDKVLKLFTQNYPEHAIKEEFHNAMVIREMHFLKPKSHELLSYDHKMGIVYDLIEGESLMDWVSRTGDIQKCAILMADLHKSILQNKTSAISSYKSFLKFHLNHAPKLTLEKKNEIFQLIEQLPNADTLCHGDFHPGNILLSNGKPFVIDFMNLCQGPPLYDIARTVFLVAYTPVPNEFKEKETLIKFKRTLADQYLIQMNVKEDMIQNFLKVIIEARKGECPDE